MLSHEWDLYTTHSDLKVQEALEKVMERLFEAQVREDWAQRVFWTWWHHTVRTHSSCGCLHRIKPVSIPVWSGEGSVHKPQLVAEEFLTFGDCWCCA